MKSILQRMVEGTYKALASIISATGRWVNELMVIGYGSFVVKPQIYSQCSPLEEMRIIRRLSDSVTVDQYNNIIVWNIARTYAQSGVRNDGW